MGALHLCFCGAYAVINVNMSRHGFYVIYLSPAQHPQTDKLTSIGNELTFDISHMSSSFIGYHHATKEVPGITRLFYTFFYMYNIAKDL